jgi:Ni,Fe-hydrogenase I large subunit
MDDVGVWQRDFLLDLFDLWLCLHGRYNFMHLGRYGGKNESTYRQNFAKPFDFFLFNFHLVKQHLSKDVIVAFDPCYVTKSGKCTDGVGYFYSGSAGQVKWGMEASGLAAVDLQNKVALHLDMVQTVDRHESETLLEYYASTIIVRKERLLSISKFLVVDAYFSRHPFVDQLVTEGFKVVSRLRKDAKIRYLYRRTKSSGAGRPRQFDGYLNVRELKEDVFTPCAADEEGKWIAYQAVVNAKALKREIKLVVVHDLDGEEKITGHRLYMSTDTKVDGGELLHMYQCRFQQEFLYRDAKQELGLEHCQAYSWQKNDYHFNVALTVGSLAKVAYHLKRPGAATGAFSIADIKQRHMNEYQARRIFALCRLDLDEDLIRELEPKIINFGLRDYRRA